MGKSHQKTDADFSFLTRGAVMVTPCFVGSGDRAGRLRVMNCERELQNVSMDGENLIFMLAAEFIGRNGFQ